MISFEEALEEVQDSFDKVVAYSQGFSTIKSTTLLTQWYQGKKQFIKTFNGLIYEHPQKISFELDEAEKIKKIKAFCSAVENFYGNEELSYFVLKQKEGFFSNAVVEEYIAPSGEKIPVGMKLVKAFKYFISDKTILDELQSEASRVIQQNKIEGTFCISVHPLDFLSASENTHNWRSCHALDGDYRAGNLSYMIDDTTLICYLKSSDGNVRLPAFPPDVPWNTKKWRMLLYINSTRNCMFAGRQYPFASDNALNIIQPIICNAVGLASRWSAWHDDQITQYKYKNGCDNDYAVADNKVLFIDNKFHLLRAFVKNNSNLHFNDVLLSSCYTPCYCWEKPSLFLSTDIKSFKIGGKPTCPICGKGVISSASLLCCDRCYESGYEYDNTYQGECACCGHLVYTNEDYGYVYDVWDEPDLYCEQCYINHTFVCDQCGRVCSSSLERYNKDTHQHLCFRCQEEVQYGER